MSATEIAEALGGAYRSGQWRRCRCPVHNSTGATLALRNAEEAYRFAVSPDAVGRQFSLNYTFLGLIDNAATIPDSEADERQREADVAIGPGALPLLAGSGAKPSRRTG